MHPEELFLSNLQLIERLVRSTCRRHRFVDADAEEFESVVKLKFVEDDYAILRQYEGRSSLSTYLYIVVQRLFLDYRDHLWGKWRPSAEAKRLGEVAIELERLTSRDGLAMSEAIETVAAVYERPAGRFSGDAGEEARGRSEDPGDAGEKARGRIEDPRYTGSGDGLLSRGEIERIAGLLPPRGRRVRVEGGEDLIRAFPAAARTDDALFESERGRQAAVVNDVLQATLQSLDPTDQLILRMRFVENLKIVTIAIALGIEQKLLYKRVERLLGTLRKAFLARGLSKSDVRELVEHGAEGVELRFEKSSEIPMTSPSHLVAKGAPNGASREE